MRSREFLLNDNSRLDPIKQQIIGQVKNIDDKNLLEKIYAFLSQSDIDKRLLSVLKDEQGNILNRDPALKSHLKELARVIAEVPGPYDEKIAFIEGLGQGYVNVDLMLSQKRVSFRDLLTPKNTDVPIYMIERIFSALENFGSGTSAKGPGEYALAIMSPEISVSGKGDLKVRDLIIEVKSSGGRIGTTGDLKMREIPNILIKYLTDQGLVELQGGKPGLSLNRFAANLDNVLAKYRSGDNLQQIKYQLIDELVDYIFSSRKLESVQKLKDAMKSGDQQRLDKLYTLAAYEAYQGTNKENFDGVMLINFSSKELQYFINPEELYSSSTVPSISLISSSERNILPPVSLRVNKKPTASLPKKGQQDLTTELDTVLKNYAEKLISMSDEPLSTKLVNDVTAYMKDLWNRNIRSEPRIKSEVYAKFPFLSNT